MFTHFLLDMVSYISLGKTCQRITTQKKKKGLRKDWIAGLHSPPFIISRSQDVEYHPAMPLTRVDDINSSGP